MSGPGSLRAFANRRRDGMEQVTGYRDGIAASTIDERLLEFVASKVADYPSFLARVSGAIDLG
jgi:hypothetical protein